MPAIEVGLELYADRAGDELEDLGVVGESWERFAGDRLSAWGSR